jgi:hypothetical protein
MSLRTTNYIAGGIQLTLCALLLVWITFFMQDKSEEISFPVGEFNGADPGIIHGHLSLGFVVTLLAIFTLITGLFHLFAYSSNSPTYQNEVDKGQNRLRWVEYSMTATIMMFVIAVLCGIGATDTLVLLVSSTLCCMLCGLLSESTASNNQRVSKISTLIG